jgi:hypothetical protein
MSRPLVLLAFVAGLAAACTSDYGNCGDGKDNDGDGTIDGDDPGCGFNQGRTEAPNPPGGPCANDLDDDGDGLIDRADPGCESEQDLDETDPPDPPPKCNDGRDNDDDGRIDYPRDPGCDDLEDDEELDGDPRACGNGSDDDGDGAVDYPDDVGCSSAADASEGDPPFMSECGTYLVVEPFPASGSADHDFDGDPYNNLQSPGCGGFGREWVWTYEVTATTALVISTDHPTTSVDTVVYLREGCRDEISEAGCADDVVGGHASFLVVDRVMPGSYTIVVDTYSVTDTGHAQVSVEPRVPPGDPCTVGGLACVPDHICRETTPGGGTVCARHECEDGVDNDGDGKTDFPNDSGCPNGDDDSELIPIGDPIPQCGNALDDDGDGLTDYPADPGCPSAAGADEIDCEGSGPITPLPAAGATGDTSVGGSNAFTLSCDPLSEFTRENVWSWRTGTTLNFVRFTVTYDAFLGDSYGLSLRRGGCGSGSESACAAGDASGTTVLTFMNPSANLTYLLIVDGGIGFAGFTYDLLATGEVAAGAACTVGDTRFPCAAGTTCMGGVCSP